MFNNLIHNVIPLQESYTDVYVLTFVFTGVLQFKILALYIRNMSYYYYYFYNV